MQQHESRCAADEKKCSGAVGECQPMQQHESRCAADEKCRDSHNAKARTLENAHANRSPNKAIAEMK